MFPLSHELDKVVKEAFEAVLFLHILFTYVMGVGLKVRFLTLAAVRLCRSGSLSNSIDSSHRGSTLTKWFFERICWALTFVDLLN